MCVLVITNERDLTSDGVILKLYEKGVEVFRLNTEKMCQGIDFSLTIDKGKMEGEFSGALRKLNLQSVTGVYYRRPEVTRRRDLDEATSKFIHEESSSFLNWLWTAIDNSLWLNHPLSIRRAESKFDQLLVADHIGFKTPKTLVTNEPEEVRSFYHQCSGRMVSKTLRAGSYLKDKDMYVIYSHPVSESELDMLDGVRILPCLFQEYIPKKYELRVTVVRDEVFSCEIHSQASKKTRHDWRRYDFDNTPHLVHKLPEYLRDQCVTLVKHYGLSYGAIDMIVTPEGEYVFLEINPNGQWAWIESLTSLPIANAIANALVSKGMKGE